MRKPRKVLLFCRTKWVVYVFFFLGISFKITAQSDRVPLKQILNEIASDFDVSLSYRAQAVADVFVSNPTKFSDIKAVQSWLEGNTELGFYHLDSRYYYITAKRNVWRLCGRILDDFTYAPIANVQLKTSLAHKMSHYKRSTSCTSKCQNSRGRANTNHRGHPHIKNVG